MTPPSAEPSGRVELSGQEFDQLSALIYRETGINLPSSKHSLVSARLMRRLRALRLGSYAAYLTCLQQQPTELEELINAITTNKTDFFREQVQFDHLEKELLPAWLARGERKLRVWSAASSTGEEAWTIAMVLYDVLPEPRRWDVKILGTDIDTQVLARAQAGVYADERLLPVGRQRLERHFVADPGGHAVGEHLRKWVQFRQLNLVAPQWPLQTRFDAVFLRNVIIYFDHDTKDHLVRRLASHVKPEGRLFVGLSEALHWLPDVWRTVGPSVYRHAEPQSARHHPARPRAVPPAPPSPPTQPAAPPLAAPPDFSPRPSAPGARPRAVFEPLPGAPPPSAPRPSAPRPSAPRASAPRPSAPRPSAPRPSAAGPRPSARSAQELGLPAERIIVGEVAAHAQPMVVSTLLGSCVAVGLYDPLARVGGLNHFLLPHTDEAHPERAASFGVHAMELLINGLMKLGGQRDRLRAKVFGGGRVLATLGPGMEIGQANLAFASDFLQRERIPVDLVVPGESGGLEVRFFTDTGQASVRRVEMTQLAQVEAVAAQYERKLELEAPVGDAELF
jgi:chemotaxis protein methyltransferase CheR